MYTWGYLKNVALANINVTEKEALQQNFINRFPYWANEVITQVSSSIKPKHTFAKFEITKNDLLVTKQMPSDFISFGADVCTRQYIDDYGDRWLEECSDNDFMYRGYNELVFLKEGTYEISYNARWITFSDNISNDTVIDVPTDILDCIPTYIAMKSLKTIDDYNSNVYKNEYEIQLARIDDTHYKTNTTLKIGGDW